MKTKRIFILTLIAIASMPVVHSMRRPLANNQEYRLLLDQDTKGWSTASLKGQNIQDRWKHQEEFLNGFENRVTNFRIKYPNFQIKVILDSINHRKDEIEKQKMALAYLNETQPESDLNPSVSDFLNWYRSDFLKHYTFKKVEPEFEGESALEE